MALWRLFRFLKKGRFDIVHGHNRGSDYWAVRLARWAGVSHTYWTRHLVYRDMNTKQIGRYRKISQSVDRVIAVSDAVKQACTEIEGILPRKVETIVNGIDLAKYQPLDPEERRQSRRKLGVEPGEYLLLFVGRFSDQKAPEAFPRLIWQLRSRGLPVKGFMCGHGPNEKDLRDQVASGPDGVTILGLRSDIPVLLGTADLFVSTSRNEGLPLNVMEAMATGTPFAAPGIPQIRELVAGESSLGGYLYDPPPLEGEVAEELIVGWADKIEAALAAADDLGPLGLAGREIISRRFSLERMVNSYESLFVADCGVK